MTLFTVAGDPSPTPEIGQIAYDSTAKLLKVYDGTAWVSIGAGGWVGTATSDLDMGAYDINFLAGGPQRINFENEIYLQYQTGPESLVVIHSDTTQLLIIDRVNKKVGLTSGTTVNEFSTDGTLAGDSDDAIPTEQATRTFAEAQRTNTHYIRTKDMDFQDAVGSHTVTWNSGHNLVEIVPDGAGDYQNIWCGFILPDWFEGTTIKVALIFGSAGNADGSFNFNWFMGTTPLSTSEVTMSYNVLSSSLGAAMSVNTNVAQVKIIERTITDADFAAGEFVGMVWQVVNMSQPFRFYGARVTFSS